MTMEWRQSLLLLSSVTVSLAPFPTPAIFALLRLATPEGASA
jgi:hypothetical protein